MVLSHINEVRNCLVFIKNIDYTPCVLLKIRNNSLYINGYFGEDIIGNIDDCTLGYCNLEELIESIPSDLYGNVDIDIKDNKLIINKKEIKLK